MGSKLKISDFDTLLQSLEKDYDIYAPLRRKDKGMHSDTDLITYGKISTINDIELNEKPRFSPKEIVYPITETLFYFTEEDYQEPKGPEKNVIIFIRPCDANGFLRLDNIFLKNGGYEDYYYKRAREKVKFFVIECTESFDTCFCVSIGTNVFDDYDVFLRFEKDDVYLDVKNSEFTHLLEEGKKTNFVPSFVEKNKIDITLPDTKALPKFYNDKLWQEYSDRCIACGRCNVSCPTCSCFTMQDIFYEDNPRCGERRRVWASCMVDGFTDMAGGQSYRKTYGERMRFKTMHKVYDYKKRFGVPMCVGCGRCDDVCPEYISFSNILKKLYNATKEEGK